MDTTVLGVLRHIALVVLSWLVGGAVVGYVVAEFLMPGHGSIILLFGAVVVAAISAAVHVLLYVVLVLHARRKAAAAPGGSHAV